VRPSIHCPSPLFLVAAILLTSAALSAARAGQIRVSLEDPAPDRVLTAAGSPVEIRGRAEILGSRAGLDVFLVLDSSKSLWRTDPQKHLAAGARTLAWNLLALGRTRIGIIDVDTESRMLAPLTTRRDLIFEALGTLDQEGKSNLATGIRMALEGFEKHAEPGSTRAVLLFTDGLTDAGEMLRASWTARDQGVAIHTILLGFETLGEWLLQEIAAKTRGTFLRMTDPARLSPAFLDLRTTGVEEVTLAVNGGEPVAAQIAGASFHGRLQLSVGENRIVARATSPTGARAEDVVTLTVRAPGCSELELHATRDGKETVSLAERNVEIVLDASNSMWGRMQDRTKLEVARRTLEALISSLPADLRIGLRAYGHRHRHELRKCEDSELLVPLGPGSREPIREAIAGLRPRGQTPLAHSLREVAWDFEGLRGERAVVLVTDGIESCGGDPVAAARDLQGNGALPVHVIGFGLDGHAHEDTASLRAIAEASGGRFLTARNARELRDALAGTVGTAFRVFRDGSEVAAGTLGGNTPIRLGAGHYSVQLDGNSPFSTPVTLTSGERLILTLEIEGDRARPAERSVPTVYTACSDSPTTYPAASNQPGP
jgi:Mg-chelatase subunit ChlD